MLQFIRCPATKIPFMYFFSGNCAASVPVFTFMCLWVIYIFPGSVHIFGCSKIDRPILEYINLSQIYEWSNWETEHYNFFLSVYFYKQLENLTIIIIIFGNKEAAQFHFWKYINGNQTFISDSHRPFICSVALFPMVYLVTDDLTTPSSVLSTLHSLDPAWVS